MRILYLTPLFDPEPSFSRGLPLARELRRLGDNVEVLTGFPNYPGGKVYAGYRTTLYKKDCMDGIPVLRVPVYPSHDGSAVRRALTYSSFAVSAAVLGSALTKRADVAFVWQVAGTMGLPAVVFKTLRRTPFVYDIPDLWPDSVVESGMLRSGMSKQVVGSVLSAWCNFVYRQAAKITVLTPGCKRLLVARGVAPDKVHILYGWTDDRIFRPVKRDGHLARQLGLDNSFNVFYGGNIGAFQGVDTIIKAACLVRHVPSIRVVILGTGQQEADMRSLALELRAHNVMFLPRRAPHEMPELYPLMDVLLIHLKDYPLFQVTIPGKTQNSLACARPIIMAVKGDAAEIVERARAGLICEPENPEAMASSILEMYRMPVQVREQFGQNGREFYLREMSQASGINRMREILQSAMESRRTGGNSR